MFAFMRAAQASSSDDRRKERPMTLRTIWHQSPADRRAERERDQAAALREYADESAALQAKTARLRALRLAKQASDAPTTAGPKKKSTPARRHGSARRP
jgi:hypothetical protein